MSELQERIVSILKDSKQDWIELDRIAIAVNMNRKRSCFGKDLNQSGHKQLVALCRCFCSEVFQGFQDNLWYSWTFAKIKYQSVNRCW